RRKVGPHRAGDAERWDVDVLDVKVGAQASDRLASETVFSRHRATAKANRADSVRGPLSTASSLPLSRLSVISRPGRGRRTRWTAPLSESERRDHHFFPLGLGFGFFLPSARAPRVRCFSSRLTSSMASSK